MKIPFLETQRLELSAPSQDALSAYIEFYTNKEASHFYGGPLTIEQSWNRLKADLGSWYLSGFGVWAIKEKHSGQVIGTCGFWKGKDWPKELTWWLLPSAHKKGYAIEASMAAIDYAYNQLHWSSVETYMNDDNVAARNLTIKLGGTKTRRMKFPDGLERDVYKF